MHKCKCSCMYLCVVVRTRVSVMIGKAKELACTNPMLTRPKLWKILHAFRLEQNYTENEYARISQPGTHLRLQAKKYRRLKHFLNNICKKYKKNMTFISFKAWILKLTN